MDRLLLKYWSFKPDNFGSATVFQLAVACGGIASCLQTSRCVFGTRCSSGALTAWSLDIKLASQLSRLRSPDPRSVVRRHLTSFVLCSESHVNHGPTSRKEIFLNTPQMCSIYFIPPQKPLQAASTTLMVENKRKKHPGQAQFWKESSSTAVSTQN